ncbi:DUF1232 domain-containing protein [Bacillus infantis]|uniref:DUF1232 domain-containing protein n=1 Tax=Bacillus infantis TaxID=324767 RepID=A0A5D4R541_9BACI|nr:DUF1232 domain-containing protein [Bacillus infantis]TYS45680.1 DUF1232 domain-containing protein [Bacillus infantis]
MAENSKEIGGLLKGLLKEQSLSMRKLGQLAGIDPAVISKIVNGKRKATPEHLQRFAEHLSVPISRLYEAAGYPLGPSSERNDSIGQIQDILETAHLMDGEFRLEDVKEELAKYEELSQTGEGTGKILSQFDDKVKKVAGMGPFIQQLQDMYEKFSLKKGTKTELALMGGALLYFIAAVDCIPDYLFPVGYLDDAVVIHWAMNALPMKKTKTI